MVTGLTVEAGVSRLGQIYHCLSHSSNQYNTGSHYRSHTERKQGSMTDKHNGHHAACMGMQISTCPRLPPQRRKEWMSGWRMGRTLLNRMNQNWGFARRPRSR